MVRRAESGRLNEIIQLCNQSLRLRLHLDPRYYGHVVGVQHDPISKASTDKCDRWQRHAPDFWAFQPEVVNQESEGRFDFIGKRVLYRSKRMLTQDSLPFTVVPPVDRYCGIAYGRTLTTRQ